MKHEEEWQDMPEFEQGSTASIKGVMIHFETKEDMDAFSKLIGRTITMKTKGVFFPVKKKVKKLYSDGEQS